MSRRGLNRFNPASRTQGKPCPKCGGTERYIKNNSCVPCANQRTQAANKTEHARSLARRAWMVGRYNLQPEAFDLLLQSQNGVCAICLTDSPGTKGWAIDHCHSTGAVRGVLCFRCNQGIGFFRDDPKLFQNAINYLVDETQRSRVFFAREAAAVFYPPPPKWRPEGRKNIPQKTKPESECEKCHSDREPGKRKCAPCLKIDAERAARKRLAQAGARGSVVS